MGERADNSPRQDRAPRSMLGPFVIASAQILLFRDSLGAETPPWDLNLAPLVALVLTAVGLWCAARWIAVPTRAARAVGVALALVSLATNPITAARVGELFRPGGEVTLENWREHRDLHAAAAYADTIDAAGKEMASRTRRFRCEGTDVVREKVIREDRRGRVRYFATNSTFDPRQQTGWYYDEAGSLRFVWDHGATQRTFLNERGEPLWAWRRTGTEPGSYGLHVVTPAQVALRTTSDAKARFDADEVGCSEL
jgi:hypothetical protein